MNWKHIALLMIVLVTMIGCGDDTAASADTDSGINTPRMQPDFGAQPCSGCYQSGECQSGREDAACGASGSSCRACNRDERCNDDGECVVPPNCNSETCDGCCDINDMCVTGDVADACGTSGARCSSCQEGTECTNNRCTSDCSPDTCAGCCDATGACVQGSEDMACGLGGLACEDCAGQGSTCGGGACVATNCSQTCAGCCMGDQCIDTTTAAACGAQGGACLACTEGQSCNNGSCEAVTGSVWDLEIVSAEISFWDWDFFSNPDPFVYAYTEDQVMGVFWENQTRTIGESFSPMWNETVMVGLTNEALQAGLYLAIYDEDLSGPEFICDYLVMPDATAFAGNIVDSPCAVDPDTSLKWRLKPSTP